MSRGSPHITPGTALPRRLPSITTAAVLCVWEYSWACVRPLTWLCVCLCVCENIRGCGCARPCVRVCVCVCVRIYTCVCVCVPVQVYVCVCLCASTCVCVCCPHPPEVLPVRHLGDVVLGVNDSLQGSEACALGYILLTEHTRHLEHTRTHTHTLL